MLWLMGVTIPSSSPFAQDSETATPAPEGDFSALRRTAPGRVEQVIDGVTVLLKDKKILRLPALDIPPDDDMAVAARDFLARELPEGTEVYLYQTRRQDIGRLNRMGQTLAHLVRKKDGAWINGRILAAGMARVMPSDVNPEKTSDMLKAENTAQQNRAGLWARYPVLIPDNADKGIGSFRIVDGVVRNAATSQNNLYLNFGDNWRTDFTVMLTPGVRKNLARRGIDALALKERHVRVRGDIREYNGPFMELINPDALEVLP